jgi:CheY-like chemotaxis protein
MGKYALIVDDDHDALELMALMVKSTGLETRTACNGLEALECLRKAETEPPALILLDLMMPGMDGFAVYNCLQGNPSTRRVPVVIVSAMEPQEINMLRLSGVRKIMQKAQFTLQAMQQLVNEVVFGGAGPDHGHEQATKRDYLLIADDQADMRETLACMADFVGVRSQTVSNGQEALELVGAQAPRLILLDLVMPVLDGFGVLDVLDSAQETRQIPVIVTSATDSPQTTARLPRYQNVRDIVIKNRFDAARLVDLIAHYTTSPA